MNDFYHITLRSNNRKTGPLVVVTSSNETCPDSCPFKKKGCYARGWPLKVHWDKVSDGRRGLSFTELLSELRKISR